MDHLRQHYILERVEVRQQVMELVDEAQMVAAHRGTARTVELRGLAAGNTYRSLEPAFEQPDGLEQSRFARTRGTEQRDDLARLHRRGRCRAGLRSSRRPG